jgi:glyoxylase-like metal-dependent hydrolase (beta-lactamase superfamily II)
MDWPRNIDGPVEHEALAGSPVQLLLGRNGSRYPFCTTLWIRNDSTDGADPNEGGALIDPGCSLAALEWVDRRQRPSAIYSTHYHFDHNRHVTRYRDLPQFLPPEENSVYTSRESFAAWIGATEILGNTAMRAWASEVDVALRPHRAASTPAPWLRPRSLIWHELVGMPKQSFLWDTEISIGSVVFIPRHFPGHSAGNAVIEFPQLRVAYVGDFDLVGFGPWYGSTDSDPIAFRDSGERLADLDVDWFITAHQKGVLPRDAFLPALQTFLGVIDARHVKVRAGMEAGKSLKEIGDEGLLYRPMAGEHDDDWKWAWDQIAVRRHAAAIVAEDPSRYDAYAAAAAKAPGLPGIAPLLPLPASPRA